MSHLLSKQTRSYVWHLQGQAWIVILHVQTLVTSFQHRWSLRFLLRGSNMYLSEMVITKSDNLMELIDSILWQEIRIISISSRVQIPMSLQMELWNSMKRSTVLRSVLMVNLHSIIIVSLQVNQSISQHSEWMYQEQKSEEHHRPWIVNSKPILIVQVLSVYSSLDSKDIRRRPLRLMQSVVAQLQQ